MTARLPEPPVPPVWLLDANVLFSDWARCLCSQLAQLCEASLLYTPLLEDEAFRNLVRLGRLSPADAQARRNALAGSLSAEVYTGDATPYLGDVSFVQKKDRPIAAAALRYHHERRVDVGLLTWNVKDFPRRQLLKKGVVRYTPDELAAHCVRVGLVGASELISLTQKSMIQFNVDYPLSEPTEFIRKAQPWPNCPAQWADFLKRNRLLMLNRLHSAEVKGSPN